MFFFTIKALSNILILVLCKFKVMNVMYVLLRPQERLQSLTLNYLKFFLKNYLKFFLKKLFKIPLKKHNMSSACSRPDDGI